MLNKVALPDGLGLRMAQTADKPFIEKLFRATREYLYLIDAGEEIVNGIINQQMQLQNEGYRRQAPNACTMIIEKMQEPVGKLIVDTGVKMIHIVDIAIVPEARGKGYGKAVLQAVQQMATRQRLPVGLSVEKQNTMAKKLYLALGFEVSEETPTHEFLLWHPLAG